MTPELTESLIALIKERIAAAAVEDRVIELRREFHRHPELSGHEERTAARVAEELESLGLEVETGIAGDHGVVGLIRGEANTPCIALRADMDALPVEEAVEVPFASEVPGVSHACGHDAHTAMLLGAAEVLARWPDALPGSVKFIFQPAEETVGGAEKMVASGVLRDPEVSAVVAVHQDSSRPVGVLTARAGQQSAATCALDLVISGAGGHGGYPHRGCDTVHLAGDVVTGLQSWISRVRPPSEPLVLTWGTISGGTKRNVMAERVELKGTFRTIGFERTIEMVEGMRGVIGGIVEPRGGLFTLEERLGYPPVVNDPALADLGRRVWTALGGECRVMDYPTMGGEDFSYFAGAVPGFLAFLGCLGDDGVFTPPHSSTFCLNEAMLPRGVEYLTAMVLTLSSPDKDMSSPDLFGGST